MTRKISPQNRFGGGASTTQMTITYDDFAKLELRVATIVEAKIHPNADKLLVLQVDLGSEKRQICAGIRAYYPPEQLVGKQVVVVANLEEGTGPPPGLPPDALGVSAGGGGGAPGPVRAGGRAEPRTRDARGRPAHDGAPGATEL